MMGMKGAMTRAAMTGLYHLGAHRLLARWNDDRDEARRAACVHARSVSNAPRDVASPLAIVVRCG